MIQLTCLMMDRLSTDELELFLVLAWLIWHQHNTVVRGGKFQDLGALNRRALDNLEEFSHAQFQLHKGICPQQCGSLLLLIFTKATLMRPPLRILQLWHSSRLGHIIQDIQLSLREFRVQTFHFSSHSA